jgi:2-keto-4-pentenoate hydratase/2-oxohepta-3-ene-1,7-dioic acid hydratase in catechol pathway
MKIVVYGPDHRTGALRDGLVIDLSYACAKRLYEAEGETRAIELAEALVPSELARLVEGGPRALDAAQQALDYLFTKAQNRTDPRGESLAHPAGTVKLHAPLPRGGRIACAGSNFATHRERMSRRSGRDAQKPFIWGFWKIIREPLGPDGAVVYPARCDRLDYEGELAVILGRRGKDLRAAQLKDFVWGVTLFCDWSIRSPREPLGPMNFAIPKNWDTSCSIGPCIAVGEADPTNVDIETFVNGERRQRHNTSTMTFSFGEYLEYLSRDLTLYPGDMIASGTGEGTAADASPVLADGSQPPDLFLKPGDTVEVRSPSVGALSARIVAKAAA